MTYEEARSDLKGILCPNCNESCDNCCVTIAVEALNAQSKLVNCKDCKHYERFDGKGGCCYYFGAMMADDDFCSTGEKRQ